MRILTVDDSTSARLIVRSAFDGPDHTIFEAPDGAIALSMLEMQKPIDVVVLDWNMPVMNGLECLREIRKHPEYATTKVIMCTTEAEKRQVMEAIKSGANGYLLKPINPDSLRTQVLKLCGVTS